MVDSNINQKVLDTMFILNTAFVTFRLYPPGSVMIHNTIERLQKAFEATFEMVDSVIFGVSERNLIVNGDPLSQKDQEKPQVTAFLEMLHNHSIKSVTFNKGLEVSELITFIEIMVQKPEEAKIEGGISKIAADRNLHHIFLNETIYVAKGKDQQIIADLNITDDQIVEYMLGENPDLQIDPKQIKEKAKDPEWVAKVFQSGIEKIATQRGMVPDNILTENTMMMMRILNRITDKMDQDKLSTLVSRSIVGMDENFVGSVLMQRIDNLFGGHLFDDIVSSMDDGKFEQIARQFDSRNRSDAAKVHTAEKESMDQAYQRLMETEKGKQFKRRDEEKAAQEKAEREKEIHNLQGEILPFLAGGKEAAFEDTVLNNLPETVRRLKSLGDQETVSGVMDNLIECLLSSHSELRVKAAEALWEIVDHFNEEERSDFIEKSHKKLIMWIELETSFTPAYEKFCQNLKNLAETFIKKGQFSESLTILDIYYLIDSGTIEKNDQIQTVVMQAIQDIASKEVLQLLLNEFTSRSNNREKEAGKVLSRIGKGSLPILLEALKKEPGSNERVRIMEVIIESGPVAINFITEKLKTDEPWYFKRNLVYLLGRIGSEDDANILVPLMEDDNVQLRQEAIKSINRIGGVHRGRLLLPVLAEVNDDIKIGIVESLGSLRYQEAVAPLLALLKASPLRSSETRILLEEKICKALGSIGSPEAMQTLKSISKPRFLNVKGYSRKVRKAAVNALRRYN